jgi:hypothetical protein
MKPEYCPDYVGVACVDGTCPIANCEEYAERYMPVISCCRDCFYYKGCEDCAISDDCDRMEDMYVEEDENFPQKLGKIAAKSCPCCGEQEEGLWRLLGRAEGFEGTVFTEESDED